MVEQQMANNVSTDLQRVDLAHSAKDKLIQLKDQIGTSFLELGAHLTTIRQHRMYLPLGYKTFEEFLADPDIDFSRTTAYNFMYLYETWVVKYKLPINDVGTVPYDKLLLVAPMLNDTNHLEVFAQAKNLSRSDLNSMKREAKLPEEKIAFPPPRLSFCKTCRKWKVLDDDRICTC